MTVTMVKMNSDDMLVCKLNFDEDSIQFSNCSSPNISPAKPFTAEPINNDINMEVLPQNIFSLRRPINRPNGRLNSPRKPLRMSNQSNGLGPMSTSPPTSFKKSYKGYHSPSNYISPPEKNVRALRLFDSPNTPKSLIEKSSNLTTPSEGLLFSKMQSLPRPTSRSRLFGSNKRPTINHSGSTPFNGVLNFSEGQQEQNCDSGVTGGSCSSSNGTPFITITSANGKETEVKDMRANVNPFTPKFLQSAKKRGRKSKHMNSSKDESSIDKNFTPLTDNSNNNIPNSKNNNPPINHEDAMDCSTNGHRNQQLHFDTEDEDNSTDTDDDEEEDNPSKRIAIHEVNVSRYHKEFVEVSLIGRGVFGSAYLCRNRLDGCLYAIKRSLKPVAGSSNERTALNEVYAHAVLGSHQHVVRYYSAWAEDDHMIIQNEYCNGGSLAQMIEKNRRKGRNFTEDQIKTILLHLAKGLKFIHSLQMVHLDVKPDNMFVSCEPCKGSTPINDSLDDGFEEESDDGQTEYTYKIGDLGHVTSVMNPKVEEGDCRYLPRELLQDDYSALPKVDIFALGLTIYEAATGRSLPLNGPEWQNIRNGILPDIPNFSRRFQDLLKMMIHNDPKMRPSASQLINHQVFNVPPTSESACKSKGQLSRELEEEKLKNEKLVKGLMRAKSFIKHLSPKTPDSLLFLKNLEEADRSFCIDATATNSDHEEGETNDTSAATRGGDDDTTTQSSKSLQDGERASKKQHSSSRKVVQTSSSSSTFSFNREVESGMEVSIQTTITPTREPDSSPCASGIDATKCEDDTKPLSDAAYLPQSQCYDSLPSTYRTATQTDCFTVQNLADAFSPVTVPHLLQFNNQSSSSSFLTGASMNFSLGSNRTSPNHTTTSSGGQVSVRQYHYNTRSQQMFQKQKYQAAHNRFVGKKAGRSQSVI